MKDIHKSTIATNGLYRAHPSIKGTVWTNYQLVMTQWPVTPAKDEAEFKANFKKKYPLGAGDPFPKDEDPAGTAISNATMETFKEFQKKESCMRCHFRKKLRGNTEFVWFLSLRAFDPNGDSNARDLLEIERFAKDELQRLEGRKP